MGSEILNIAVNFVSGSSPEPAPESDIISFITGIPATLDSLTGIVILLGIIFAISCFFVVRKFGLFNQRSKCYLSNQCNKSTATNKAQKRLIFGLIFVLLCSLFIGLLVLVCSQVNSKAIADSSVTEINAYVEEDGTVSFDNAEINNLFNDKYQSYEAIAVTRNSEDYQANWEVWLDGISVYHDVCGKTNVFKYPLEKDPGQSLRVQLSSSLNSEQAKLLIGTSPIQIQLTRANYPYEFYDVTFDMQEHGEQIDTQNIKYGHLAQKPEDPNAAGFTFAGWFKNQECTISWDYDSDKVYEPTSIYAKWVENEAVDIWYTNWNGGSVSSYHEKVMPFSGQAQGSWAIQDELHDFYDWSLWDATEVGDFYHFIPSKNDEGIYEENVYYANFEFIEVTYTVKYDNNGGEGEIDDDVVTERAQSHTFDVKDSTGISKEKYVFMGWSSTPDGEVEYKPGSEFTLNYPDHEATLYAVWKQANTVSFDVQGLGEAPPDQYVETGKTVERPKDPESVGYIFGGWYTESQCTNVWNFQSDKVQGDMTLYAKWVPREDTNYSISIKTQDLGKDGLPCETYTDFFTWSEKGKTGDTIEVCPPDIDGFETPAKQYVTIAPDGSSSVQFSYNRRLFSLKINYLDVATGKSISNAFSAIYGYGYHFSITSPEIVGYTASELTVEGYIEKATEIDVLYEENEDAFIYYSARTHGSVGPCYAEKVAPVTGSPVGSTATADPGYKFVNWTTYDYSTGTEIEVSTNQNFVPQKTSEGVYVSKIYYANFELNENTFTLTYNGNQESGSTDIREDTVTEQSLSHLFVVKGVDEFVPEIAKEGYRCVGWSSSPDGPLEFTSGSPLSVSFDENKTLYAIWEKLVFTVTFDLRGKGQSFSQQVEYGELVKPVPTPIAVGYVFENWYKDDQFNTPWDFGKDQVTDNTTLFAKWNPQKSNTTFVGNFDGSTYSVKIEQTYGEKYELPETKPLRTGYTFKEWNSSPDGSGDQITATTDYNLISDNTVYAQWTEKTINVTFVWNNQTSYSETITQTYGQNIELPENTPQWQGHIFKLWNTDSSGVGEVIDENTKILTETDFNVYAIYDELIDLSVGTITINHSSADEAESLNDEPSDTAKTVYIVLSGLNKTSGEWETIDYAHYGPDTPSLCNVVTNKVGDDYITTITRINSTFSDIKNTYSSYWINVYNEELGYSVTPEEGAEVTKTVSPEFSMQKSHYGWKMTYTVNTDTPGVQSISKVYTQVTRYIGWTNDQEQYQTFQTIPQHERSAIGSTPNSNANCNVWYYDTDTSHTYPESASHKFYYRCNVVGFKLADSSTILYDADCPYTATVNVKNGVDLQLKDKTTIQAVSYDALSEQQVGEMIVDIKSKSYTVSFDSNGGTSVSKQTVPYGQKVTEPTVTKTGYKLDGWFSDSKFTSDTWDFSTDTVKNDITLYAKWSPGTVTYQVNHTKLRGVGDPVIYPETIKGITGNQTAAKALQYSGYVSQPFNQQTIAADSSTVVTIYYDEQICTINYKSNYPYYGSVTRDEEQIYCDSGTPQGSEAQTLSTSFEFKYWCNSNDEIVSYESKFVPQKNAKTDIYDSETYTACFALKKITYSIVYMANNDTTDESFRLQTKTISATSWTFQLQSSEEFQKKGYEFEGWGETREGPTKYHPGNSLTLKANNPTKYLYAIWKKVDYEVKFDVQGHGSPPSTQYKQYGSLVDRPSDPYADNFYFEGWYKESACINAWDFNKDLVYGPTTIYAKWREIKPLEDDQEFSISNTGYKPAFKTGELPQDLLFYDSKCKLLPKNSSVNGVACYSMQDLVDAAYYTGESYFKTYAVTKSYNHNCVFDYTEMEEYTSIGFGDAYEAWDPDKYFLTEANKAGITSVVCKGCESDSWRQRSVAPTVNGITYSDFATTYEGSSPQHLWAPFVTWSQGNYQAYVYNPNFNSWYLFPIYWGFGTIVKKDFNCCNITGSISGSHQGSIEDVGHATIQFVSEDESVVYASSTSDKNGDYYLSVPHNTKGKIVITHSKFEKYVDAKSRTIVGDMQDLNFTMGVGFHTVTLVKTPGIDMVQTSDGKYVYDQLEVADGSKFALKVTYKTTQRLCNCFYKASSSWSEQEIFCEDGYLIFPEVTEDATVTINSIGNLVLTVNTEDGLEKLWYHPEFEDENPPDGIDFYSNGEKITGKDGSSVKRIDDLVNCDGYVVNKSGSSVRCYTTVDKKLSNFVSTSFNSDENKILPSSLNKDFYNTYVASTASSVETLYNSTEGGWYQDDEEWTIPKIGSHMYADPTSASGFYNVYHNGLSSKADKCWSASSNRFAEKLYFDASSYSWDRMSGSNIGAVVLSKVFSDTDHVCISGLVRDSRSTPVSNASIELANSDDYHYKNDDLSVNTNANEEGYYSVLVKKVNDNFQEGFSEITDGFYVNVYKDKFATYWGEEKYIPDVDKQLSDVVFSTSGYMREVSLTTDDFKAGRIKIVDLDNKHIYNEGTKQDGETEKFYVDSSDVFNFRVVFLQNTNFQNVYGVTVDSVSASGDISHITDEPEFDYYSIQLWGSANINISWMGNLCRYTSYGNYKICYHPYWEGEAKKDIYGKTIFDYVKFYKDGVQITDITKPVVDSVKEANGIYVEAETSILDAFDFKCYAVFQAGNTEGDSGSSYSMYPNLVGYDDAFLETSGTDLAPVVNKSYLTSDFVSSVLAGQNNYAQVEEIDNMTEGKWSGVDWSTKDKGLKTTTYPVIDGLPYCNGQNGFYDLYKSVDDCVEEYGKKINSADIYNRSTSNDDGSDKLQHKGIVWALDVTNDEPKSNGSFQFFEIDYSKTCSCILTKHFCNDKYRQISGTVYDKNKTVGGYDKFYDYNSSSSIVPYQTMSGVEIQCTYTDYDGTRRTVKTLSNSDGAYTLTVPKHAVEVVVTYEGKKTQRITLNNSCSDEFRDFYLEKQPEPKPLSVTVDTTVYNFYPVFSNEEEISGYDFYVFNNGGEFEKIETDITMDNIYNAVKNLNNKTLYYVNNSASEPLSCYQTIDCTFDQASSLYIQAFNYKKSSKGEKAEWSPDMTALVGKLGASLEQETNDEWSDYDAGSKKMKSTPNVGSTLYSDFYSAYCKSASLPEQDSVISLLSKYANQAWSKIYFGTEPGGAVNKVFRYTLIDQKGWEWSKISSSSASYGSVLVKKVFE